MEANKWKPTNDHAREYMTQPIQLTIIIVFAVMQNVSSVYDAINANELPVTVAYPLASRVLLSHAA